MAFIISLVLKLIEFIIGMIIGMGIMAYSASKEIAQACDDAYLIGYSKGKEENEHDGE